MINLDKSGDYSAHALESSTLKGEEARVVGRCGFSKDSKCMVVYAPVFDLTLSFNDTFNNCIAFLNWASTLNKETAKSLQ